jgi:hypothetical protein
MKSKKEENIMKLTLKIKFWQYLNDRRDRENGSIWIRVLVLAIALGILGFFLLPKFFGNKGKEMLSCCRGSEGANNVAAMNYAQQELYLKKQIFAIEPNQLQAKFRSNVENYKYEIIGTPKDKPTVINHLATPIVDGEKAYLGIVRKTIMNDDIVTIAIACESVEPTGKNPTWIGLPTEENEYNINCDRITVGGQGLIDSGLLSFSRVGEQENILENEQK